MNLEREIGRLEAEEEQAVKEATAEIMDKVKQDKLLEKLDRIENPPITKDEIMATRDAKKRINLIAENAHLFN